MFNNYFGKNNKNTLNILINSLKSQVMLTLTALKILFFAPPIFLLTFLRPLAHLVLANR